MAISSKLMRMQISFFKNLAGEFNIETARSNQARLGALSATPHKMKVCYAPKVFKTFLGEWAYPKMSEKAGVILYLHGGGYVTGDIDYAKGFGTTLAAKYGIPVFCAAYRLAPEFPFPAALDDALVAYRYLLGKGFEGTEITLCGESAGGGLCYSLVHKLKELTLPLPRGIIAISPWTDLSSSGKSYEKNREIDPTITKERLAFYAAQYILGKDEPDQLSQQELKNPFISPLFGDLNDFPPSLIFVGGDEVMLDDARLLHKKLLKCGCQSELSISSHMWHCYILYDVEEAKPDYDKIASFLEESSNETA